MTQRRREAATGRRDLYAEVTSRITAALECGTVPWRRPWHTHGIRIGATNRPYRGKNLLLLGLVAVERGYDDRGGALLAPREQWGEETGESLADVLRIP